MVSTLLYTIIYSGAEKSRTSTITKQQSSANFFFANEYVKLGFVQNAKYLGPIKRDIGMWGTYVHV